jgi:hypothetical protein
VSHPFEPAVLVATLAMIPVLIIERDASSPEWLTFAQVAGVGSENDADTANAVTILADGSAPAMPAGAEERPLAVQWSGNSRGCSGLHDKHKDVEGRKGEQEKAEPQV